MTPSQLMSYARWTTNINSVAPFDNATLLPLVNTAKDNISQAIIQINPDYFGEISTAQTISGQQEYTKPAGLVIMKRIDVSYTDTNVGSYYPGTEITLNDISKLGEDWYATYQPTTTPLYRFDDTGFFLYPTPQATTSGSAFLRLWWVPKRTNFTDLTDSTNDIESSTGIGGIFHPLIGDILVNWIRNKQGTLSAMDVQNNNQHVLDILVPSAFRQLSTTTSKLPNDTKLQY
jgi:hypothetical protein